MRLSAVESDQARARILAAATENGLTLEGVASKATVSIFKLTSQERLLTVVDVILIAGALKVQPWVMLGIPRPKRIGERSAAGKGWSD